MLGRVICPSSPSNEQCLSLFYNRLTIPIEFAFEISDNAQDFIKIRRRFEKHFSSHRFVITAPVRSLILGWYQSKRTTTKRRVVNPTNPKIRLAMHCYVLE